MSLHATSFWQKRGLRAALAKEVDLRPHHLSEILRRFRGVSVERAMALDNASVKVLGERRRIPWHAWVNNRRTDHRAFFGKPQK